MEEFLLGLSIEEGFRSFLLEELAASPHEAFFWEMPPLCLANLRKSWECAIIASPALETTRADPTPFAQHFDKGPEANSVVAFPNLSGDATLIVPKQVGPIRCYGHLARFIRNGPNHQKHELLELVSNEIQREVSDKPLWVSTAGMGVPWLHVRLDSWPKYYSHHPYRDAFGWVS